MSSIDFVVPPLSVIVSYPTVRQNPRLCHLYFGEGIVIIKGLSDSHNDQAPLTARRTLWRVLGHS